VRLIPIDKLLGKLFFVHAKASKVVRSLLAFQKFIDRETAIWRTIRSIGLIVSKLILQMNKGLLNLPSRKTTYLK
jgi:hypothetical protein